MSHTYENRKRAGKAAPQKKETAAQPSMEALRSGAVQPTAEQMGHRVDLPEVMRAKMENAFGADLSAVKLYESQAVEDAGAKAIAQGPNIAFAPGLLDFTSFGGQSLLGHEISHVVSQARGEVTGGGFLNDSALEARADREGAMAAAGRQVAMPTAALSGVTAAAAAGPMQAKEKDKDKKKGKAAAPAVPAVPENLTFNQITPFKPGGGEHAASVAKIGSAGGESAVVKTGEDADVESALSAYHNVAGKTFSEKHGGTWSFNAPAARALTPAERDAARSRIGRNGTEAQPSLNSTRTRQDIANSMAASGAKDETEDELNHMVAYSMAGGKSRFDPKRGNWGGNERKRFEKEGDSAILTNPTDQRENADYERMMGYIALTDVVTGNTDRLAGALNPLNWMEERDTRQAHLIDNNYIQSDSALSRGEEGRGAYLNLLSKRFGEGAASKGKLSVADRFIQGLASEENDASGATAEIFGQNGSAGAAQAISDLPGMRKQMQSEFEKQNNGQPLNKHQQEILERMQILHEYTTNPEMAALYKKLGDTYKPSAGPDGKEIDQSQARADLEEQIRAMRAAAAPQQAPAAAPAQAPAAPFVPGEKTSDQTFAYRTTAVPQDFDPETATEDEGLAMLYRKIKNPDPNDDEETISARKRFFAQQRAAQMERQRRKSQS